MDYKEIRWKQRFDNFSKAFSQLEEAMNLDTSSFNKLEKSGVYTDF